MTGKQIGLALLMLAVSLGSGAVELMRWERIPLTVTVNAGQERIVFVERNVRVGYPASLEGKLRIQSAGGTVYLLASEAFPSIRLQLRDVENGELILLDIRAIEGKTVLEPVRLIYENERTDTSLPEGKSREAQGNRSKPAAPVSTIPIPVALTRYAAQNLYAPLRVVEGLPGVQQVSARLPAQITTLLPTEPVNAVPLAAWRKDSYVVTAIRLQNIGSELVSLDPRALQGNFYAATFQHGWLGPAGSTDDTTVVYLVTRDSQADRAILPEPARPPAKLSSPKAGNRGNK